MALQGSLQLLKLTWIDEAVEGLLTPPMRGESANQKWGNTPFGGRSKVQGIPTKWVGLDEADSCFWKPEMRKPPIVFTSKDRD